MPFDECKLPSSRQGYFYRRRRAWGSHCVTRESCRSQVIDAAAFDLAFPRVVLIRTEAFGA